MHGGRTIWHLQRERESERGEVCAHSSRSVLPQEALHVSSSHQLQQDETWQDVQAHSDAADYVLVAEFAANQTRKNCLVRQAVFIVCFSCCTRCKQNNELEKLQRSRLDVI